MGGEIAMINHVEGSCLGREAVDEHVMRGLGDCGRRRARRSRYKYVIRFKSASDRFDCVVHCDLDSRIVQEADRTAMSGPSVYDRLYGDCIPIGYCVGSYDGRNRELHR